MTRFRLGELFSGPGGLGIAAHHASIDQDGWGIETTWASDQDEDTCKTYAHNVLGADPMGSDPVWHGQPHRSHPPRVYCADIRELDTEVLPAIDALAFGAPCNDFSVIGEKLAFSGRYGPLYREGAAVLESHRPQWFLFENVGGIRGDCLDQVMRDFAAVGYRLTPHLYDFSDYGVPQKRRRVVVIGIRDDLDVEFRVPAPISADVTAGTALADIADGAANHEFPRMGEKTIERLSHIEPGENAWTANLPEHLKIRTKTTISSMYRRLDPEKPSYTVTGNGGGGFHIYHWDQHRALTNRERARLQSFDDGFSFVGGRESVRKQIGMAVPPRGAQAIFTAVLKSFAGIGYPHIKANITSITDSSAMEAVV